MIKIKPLTKEQLIISIDRLTRFKNPELKYLRVFKEIIVGNLITPKFKKTQLDEMNYKNLKDYAEEIINFSINALGYKQEANFLINQRLYDYEKNTFILNPETEELLKNKINYKSCVELIGKDAVINLQWLKSLEKTIDSKKARNELSLKYPIEKVVITEGITEEILLPEFAKQSGYDFNKEGIHMISAGGKNQVVKLYYQLSESIKIPIFILLDKDAEANYMDIKRRLRDIDRIHILKCGEFEDGLSKELVKKTLIEGLKNISMVELEAIDQDISMVKILEAIFKHRGHHEFKKSEFAIMLKENISNVEDMTTEIKEVVNKISQNEMVDN